VFHPDVTSHWPHLREAKVIVRRDALRHIAHKHPDGEGFAYVSLLPGLIAGRPLHVERKRTDTAFVFYALPDDDILALRIVTRMEKQRGARPDVKTAHVLHITRVMRIRHEEDNP